MNKFIAILIVITGLIWIYGFYLYISHNVELKSQKLITKSLTETPTPTDIPTPTEYLFSAERLMALVNEWRVSQGYQPYIESEWLCDQAAFRLGDIQTDYSHKGLFDRYEGKYDLSENLSYDVGDEASTLNEWINSPSHRKNLERPLKYACIRCNNKYCVNLFSN